jgi:hypothetical protein
MTLDAIKEAAELQRLYAEKERKKTNFFIYGDKGSGKTTLLTTAPRPILVDSFDDGGTQSIMDEIAQGWILADTRWEKDDPDSPHKWVEWLAEMDRRRKEGFFNILGTYAIDSLTMLQQLSMNYILKQKGRKDGIPEAGKGKDNDYVVSQTGIERVIGSVLDLSCNIVITAHPDFTKDEDTKIRFIGPAVTGQMKVRLPLMFSEFYYMKSEVAYVKQGDTMIGHNSYVLLTRPDGLFRASTRLGRKEKFDLWEKADIKYILQKGGVEAKDKEIPWMKK